MGSKDLTTSIIRRCSTKYSRARANLYDPSLKTTDLPLQTHMNGTFSGPPVRAKVSYTRASTSIKGSITFHRVRKLRERTDSAPILSRCRNVLAERRLTSYLTRTSYLRSFMTSTFTFKS